MLIKHPLPTTTLSMRLPTAALSANGRCGASIEGRLGVTGTTLSAYDVRVPAFLKGGAFPGVRAWSPPV